MNYNKLWKLLIDKQLNKTDLCKLCKFSPATIAKLSKRKNVTTNVLERICHTLHCKIDDIMEIEDEKNEI